MLVPGGYFVRPFAHLSLSGWMGGKLAGFERHTPH